MVSSSKRSWLGIVATVVGALAIVAAIMPIWVLPLIDPPDPIDKVVVDTAQKIKNRLVAKAKGTTPQEPTRRKKRDWYELMALVGVSLGVATLILSAASFVAQEPWRFGAAGAALGSAAIIFQLSLMIAFALLGIFVVWVVLQNLDALAS